MYSNTSAMCIVYYHNDHIIFNSLFLPEVKTNKIVDFSKGSLKIIEKVNIQNVIYCK